MNTAREIIRLASLVGTDAKNPEENLLKALEAEIDRIIGPDLPEQIIQKLEDGVSIVQINHANNLIKEQRQRLREFLEGDLNI